MELVMLDDVTRSQQCSTTTLIKALTDHSHWSASRQSYEDPTLQMGVVMLDDKGCCKQRSNINLTTTLPHHSHCSALDSPEKALPCRWE